MAEKRVKNNIQIFLNYLQELETFVKNDLNTSKKSQVKLRRDDLISRHTDFLKLQSQLEGLDEAEIASETRATVDRFYFSLRPALDDRMEEFKPTEQKPEIKVVDELNFLPKLPDLVIEPFYGDITKWQSFIEAFDNHIHNNSRLNPIAKFQYLRNFVRNSAAKTFENLDFVAINYEEARRLLKERFDRPNLIAEEHIRALVTRKQLEKPNGPKLLELLDEFNSHIRSLKSLGRPTDYWDDLIVYLISSKFDAETQTKWREFAPINALPSFEDVSKFIKIHSQRLDCLKIDARTSTSQKPKPSTTPTHSSPFKPPYRKSHQSFHANATKSYSCINCKQQGHSLMRCHHFLALSTTERRKIVDDLKLCANCLRSTHLTNDCPLKEFCRICNLKHHSLLHIATPPPSSAPIPSSSSSHTVSSTNNQSSAFTSSANSATIVILATALVEVYDNYDSVIFVRAMLDSGSQLNFISKSLASKLGLKCKKSDITVNGIGCSSIPNSDVTTISFRSRTSHFSSELDVHVLPKISGNLPSISLDPTHWKIPPNIELADPDFQSSKPIDLLIGANLFFELQSVGQIRLGDGLPILQKTQLGWIVSGNVNISTRDAFCNLAHSSSSEILDNLLERFWTIEEADNPPQASEFANECEDHFSKTYSQDETGRFVVRLPFSASVSNLGNSSMIARKRFLNLEARLSRDEDIRKTYSSFMQEYLDLGHMELMNEPPSPNYYLPHHCVIKPDSSSTKLRVVFDGSSNTSTGSSLNSILMNGPVVQNELFAILLRFRAPAFAISADIEKMYRQVLLHPDDRKFQCIFWRFSPDEQLKTYQLKTVTYGTTSAPYLATRCLKQLALDNQTQYPIACSALQHDVYVDDLLTGSNSFNEVLQIKSELVNILNSAGMNLRKWCANDPLLLDGVPDVDKEKLYQFEDDNFVTALGLYWHSVQDNFRIKVNLPETPSKTTKRSVMSEVAKIYDPIGLISPVVIIGKMLMQDLWQLKVDWDESLPMHIHSAWESYRHELNSLKHLYIRRHLFDHCTSPTDIQIHGFADSSEKAYGAAVYVRCKTSSGYITTLYCSKSRVAPLKKSSIPRLELCAAQLLVCLVQKIMPILNFSVSEYFFWTDSTIVLHWLNSPSARWNTFVANRVAKIQAMSNVNAWRHVESESNPADLISRGKLPKHLIKSTLWWNGPSFLRLPDDVWSKPFRSTTDVPVPELRRSEPLFSAAATVECFDSDYDVFSRINHKNNFLSIQNVFSYMLRFINNASPRRASTYGPLTGSEARNGFNAVIRAVQIQAFPEMYWSFREPPAIVKDPLKKCLSLFMHTDNLIRVGGRIKHSSLAHNSKHPALVPSDHTVIVLMVNFLHITHLHTGPQGLLAAIRQSCWPINGRTLARRVYSKCVICRRASPKLLQQKMSDLPKERVNQSPPFNIVGVDYCGPFFVHYSIRGKQPTKAYLAVFVCLVTKAVHFELASTLTTASFMGALRRFVATRGLPSKIYSDNGTNFVGAHNELYQLFLLLQSADLANEIKLMCQKDQIDWMFAPAGSPHFGGIYEAAVKSAKFHLRRMLHTVKLTFEEFNTLIKQVESVLNSRPLVPISGDDTIEVLTPGHFLIGRPLMAIPQPLDLDDINSICILSKWDATKKIFAMFWVRWSSEYLQTLQHRYKWVNQQNNIQLGQIVVIKDENLPPLKWRFGKIIATHPGPDNLIRVVTLKTATGECKRSITKIAPLPVDIEPQDVQGGENV